LYGGLFQEVFEIREFEPYGHFTFQTTTYKIFVIDTIAQTGFLIDPVAFAYDFGARMYDARLGIFTSVDPLARKYHQWSPYSAFANNPIYFVDPDGKEPIKPRAGTAAGFVTTINTTGTKLGLKTGTAAHTAMLGLGKTEFSMSAGRPMPINTQRINTFSDKYIYTEKGGWLDMAHFMFYAGKAYEYKLQKLQAQEVMNSEGFKYMQHGQAFIIKQATLDPVGEAVQDGYYQEMSDRIFAKHSAYSYEDLPSDKFGAEFGAKYFDPNSKSTFGEQLQNYLNGLGATSPQNAPNFNSLPSVEPDKKPSRTNHTTTPIYTKE
jgi:RHS repeat-associated protein